MRNAGNKKLRLVLLALALLSLSMVALGGTLANGTEVDMANTTQQELTNTDKEYNISISCRDTANSAVTLASDTPIFTDDVLWCPGYTKLVYLDITNNEAFPANCTLTMKVGESKLNNVMVYATGSGNPTSWNDILTSWNPQKLTAGSHAVFSNVNFQKNAKKTFALAVHMNESATNEYQNQTLDISFELTVNANFKPGETNLTDPK